MLGIALDGPAAAVEPSPGILYGVGTHFAFDLGRGYYPATQMPHLRDLGVQSFRDDVNADEVVAPSMTHPVGTRLDRLSSVLRMRLWTPVLILRGPGYPDGDGRRYVPVDSAEIEAFARYAKEIVATTRPFGAMYEIWNEWNVEWRRPPLLGGLLRLGDDDERFSPERYVETAKPVYRAIKAVDPSAVVLTGAIGDDPDWTFTRRALAAGLLETGDGISVHFYNHCEREARRTAERLIEKAEAFRDVIREGRPETLPVYITEFGWPNQTGRCAVPEDVAAANFAQFTLWAGTIDWIKGIWAYELRNSGADEAEPEHNFGLFHENDAPKPAACAYREAIRLSRELGHRSFQAAPDGVRRLTGRSGDGRDVSIVWTTERDGRAVVGQSDGQAKLRAKFLCGSDVSLSNGDIEFGMMPLVIEAMDAQPLSLDVRSFHGG